MVPRFDSLNAVKKQLFLLFFLLSKVFCSWKTDTFANRKLRENVLEHWTNAPTADKKYTTNGLYKWAEQPRGIIGLPKLAADLVVPSQCVALTLYTLETRLL